MWVTSDWLVDWLIAVWSGCIVSVQWHGQHHQYLDHMSADFHCGTRTCVCCTWGTVASSVSWSYVCWLSLRHSYLCLLYLRYSYIISILIICLLIVIAALVPVFAVLEVQLHRSLWKTCIKNKTFVWLLISYSNAFSSYVIWWLPDLDYLYKSLCEVRYFMAVLFNLTRQK